MIRFHALGGLSITDAHGDPVGIGGPRQRRLLAALLIHRNAVVSVDRLAEAVFAGEPTPAASTTLRSYVARVRKVLDSAQDGTEPRPVLVTQAPGYALRVPDDAFDVARFERLVAEATACLAREDALSAAAAAREALELWRGTAYAEFADEDWVMPEAQRLDELRLVAQERRIDAELACGHAAEVAPLAESLAREHPLREAFRAQLMLALYRNGRHAEALQVYREYRATLVAELGVEPTPRLADLERRILGNDESLLLVEPVGRPLRGYRLGERLGTGRDGTVYAADLPGVERDVVVRVYREELADRASFVRDFDTRAHRLASLHHPAIVPIHDHWREPGTACLVMRRMYGGSLADRLAAGTLSPESVVALVRRIGGALAAAAEQGVGHGRVVAESVLYDEDGDPCLSDFALGADDPPRTGGDDVHDLAVLVARCLPTPPDAVADVLDRGRAASGRPSIDDFVASLLAALTGPGASLPTRLPNPFKGLQAYDEADAADFFGRADLVAELLDRLGRDDLHGRLALVVGGSGTGKSSVVRAGLLPRVRRGDVAGSGRWFVTAMMPGSEPFKELAESLRRVAVAETPALVEQLAADGGIDRVLRRLVPSDGQLLLLIDQFEELFTLASTEDQRTFLDGLVDAVAAGDSRLRVVATLRADFYDRPLAARGFGPLVHAATVAVPAMSPAELESAIVGPVERVGGSVEPALVAELVSAVADEPAALPSLQFTLYELAEDCPDLHLTLAAYRDLGGVAGAIAARAEALYVGLDDTERAGVRRMFERLVVIGPEGEPTRRRAARTELSADAVVEPWAQARLLTLDRDPHTRVPTVELAHEAMLRAWPRLRGWIEQDREQLVVLGQLRDAARTWARLERDPSGLYRGARLQVALDVTNGGDDLSDLEQDFLAAGVEERDRERRTAEEVAARQARANRRLRVQLVAIGAALVIALVGGIVALDQRSDAQQERREASARALAAAAVASLDEDPERSILLALAAVDETRSHDGTVLREPEEALHRAVSASRILLNVPTLGGAVDWSPDGGTFVTEGPEDAGEIDIRDAATGESVRSWIGHEIDVNDVAFSGDGTRLATTGDDGAVRVWDPATGELRGEFQSRQGAVYGPSFSPDGRLVAAAWTDEGMVRVVDVERKRVLTEIHDVLDQSVEFSPDGRRIAYAPGDDGGAIVVDAGSGRRLHTVADGSEVSSVAWSPDGQLLATSSWEGVIDLWAAGSGEARRSIDLGAGNVNRIAWSRDATMVAAASFDGSARVWRLDGGQAREVATLAAQDTTGGGIYDAAFSPDGERLITGDAAVTSAKVWDIRPAGGGEWPGMETSPVSLLAVFTHDGSGIASSPNDALVTIRDIESGRVLRRVRPRGFPVDVTPDGELLVTVDPVRVWDVVTGEEAFALSDAVPSTSGTWSGDAQHVAVAWDDDGTPRVRIVDRSGTELATLDGEPGFTFWSMNFSRDGERLVTTRRSARTAGEGEVAEIWDWRRGTVLRTIDTPARDAVFDPAGRRLVTTDWYQNLAQVWDVETGDRVATFAGHAGGLAFLDVSPDGSTVATASADATVRLWDLETGRERLTLDTGSAALEAGFSPDGSKLVTVNVDGLVRVWALDLDDLIGIAEDRLTRGLIDRECQRYLQQDSCPAR